MKIGLDIDGVIFDSENEIRIQAELDDLLKYKGRGVEHPEEFWEVDRYNWTDEQLIEFRSSMREILERAHLMPGAKRILDMLKKDGHELIVNTARGRVGPSVEECMEQFKSYDLEFDKCYWKVDDKAEIYKKENIDLMIDDSPIHCKKLVENKIKTLYFRDVNREKLEENEYLKEVNHWGEIYRYIYNLSMEEK